MQGVSCDPFLRSTHAPRTSRCLRLCTRVCTFILWWSHFAPARFTIFIFWGIFFWNFYALFWQCTPKRIFHEKIASTIYKLTKKSLNSDIKKAISGHFSFKSVQKVIAHRTHKKGPQARTSHARFRMLFARTLTHATAHRMCACALPPSQLTPSQLTPCCFVSYSCTANIWVGRITAIDSVSFANVHS